jgi:cytochrome c oxidase subunit IV
MLAFEISSYLPPSLSHALAGYPSWLVATACILAALVALWILGKLLKWTLYLILIVLAAGCVGVILWMALNALHLLPAPAAGS